MRSSKAAVDLIVSEEVSSKARYESHYQRPEWPGGASGVTVGIGYDLGYSTPERVMLDWKDYLPPDVVQAMQSVAGLTGMAARAALAGVRGQILVPWDAAISVFMKIDMPKWESIVLRACPGSEKLPAGCFGVATGLAYNRGASFSKEGDRYTEMRAIRMSIASGEWDKVPGRLRDMKRLWPNVEGLQNRREHEADLWERSLAAYKPDPSSLDTARVDTGDDHEVTPEGNDPDSPLNVQPVRGRYDPEVEAIQKQLAAMHYHEVGLVDGISGGKLKGAIAAFMTDRNKAAVGDVTPEFKAELAKAAEEGWSRPISPARANATAKDIAPNNPSVSSQWYQKLFAYVLGAPAALTAGFKAVFGEQTDPTGYVAAVKNFFGSIPPEYYWLAVTGVAIAVLYQAKKAQDATVKAYQQGKIN